MPPRRKVLFLANREHGACNVHLAVSHEFLVNHQDLEVHFVSFRALEKHVQAVSDQAAQRVPKAIFKPIIFHPLDGPSITETIAAQLNVEFCEAMTHPPGVAGAVKAYSNIATFAAGWTGEEHLKLYAAIAGYVKEIGPKIVVLDPVFIPGVEACRDLKVKYVMLSPNSLKDVLAAQQPWGAMLWKYPM